ncbi:hypothetical protein [Pseudomonas sp. LP_7_YM]|uniref:hypothetical protein n=1 Tax=Pseudomonas sp. LP_7_YM TaxID=2485137 RepID=UPI001061E614|nr:hypothetical protein [Pseudomonas sp. LP_7_YM]
MLSLLMLATFLLSFLWALSINDVLADGIHKAVQRVFNSLDAASNETPQAIKCIRPLRVCAVGGSVSEPWQGPAMA